LCQLLWAAFHAAPAKNGSPAFSTAAWHAGMAALRASAAPQKKTITSIKNTPWTRELDLR